MTVVDYIVTQKDGTVVTTKLLSEAVKMSENGGTYKVRYTHLGYSTVEAYCRDDCRAPGKQG